MSAISEMPTDTLPTKKPRSKKALKPKNNNILPESSPSLIASVNTVDKENLDALSQPKSNKKTKKGGSKAKKPEMSVFEKELQEMQEKLEKLKIEKEQTEETLKARDEELKKKDEELENREKEQEKLKCELKKLQKMKEFKPVMTLPFDSSNKEQEEDKKEKKKKKADPSKKKPSPPYAMWCKDQWNEVKKDNPDADFKEMSGLLGAKWKTITAEEKKSYEEKYQAEKEAYLKVVGHEKREQEAMRLLEDEQKQKTAMDLLEQYLQFKEEAGKEENKKKKGKKEKDPLKPKKPMSAYFLFSKERGAALRAENKNVLEVAKITGEEWNKMSEKQKAPFVEMALKLKEQYMQEMEVYNQNKDEEATNLKKEEEELHKLHKQEAMQLLKKKEKTDNLIKKTKEDRQKQKKEKIVDPNKPKKPASSFFLFSKETRKCLMEERPGINNCTITALISVKWKELGEEEKQVWNSKAAETMEVYKKELAAYNNSLAAEESQNKN